MQKNAIMKKQQIFNGSL